MTTGTIFDIKHYAVHDGPGIRATVFMKGCPLSCWWCHNPESQSPQPVLFYRREACVGCGSCVSVCPEDALRLVDGGVLRDDSRCTLCGACANACPAEALECIGRIVSADEVVREVERDRLFFDESGGGVTFSGGEPLAQPDFLLEMLRLCGRMELHRAVDTSGYASEDVLRRVAEHVDLFLYDLKVMDPEAHRGYTGVDNECVRDNLRLLAELAVPTEVRVPIIPGITDAEDNLDAIGRFLASLPRVPDVTLLPHHRIAMDKFARFGMTCRMPDVERPSCEELDAAAERLRAVGLTVNVPSN